MKPLIVGIAGGTGSGKSTVAHCLAEALPGQRVSFLEMDSYYHDLSKLVPTDLDGYNWDHPDAFDLKLLASHLAMLAAGEPVPSPQYDFTNHCRKSVSLVVEPADIVIIDGILLLVDEAIRACLDFTVFLDTDPDIRLLRRIRRDMEVRGRSLDSILTQYLTTVRPMHAKFVEPSKRFASIVIDQESDRELMMSTIVREVFRRLEPESLLESLPESLPLLSNNTSGSMATTMPRL